MESFKPGDRVITTRPGRNHGTDEKGVILESNGFDALAIVETDEDKKRLSIYESSLDYDLITIRTDGHRTVTACYGCCKAKARCSPDDEFNIMTGIEIALSRLKEQIGTEASERFALDKLEQSTDKPETSNEPDDEPETDKLREAAQDRAIYVGGVTITRFNLTINKGDTK